MHPSEDEVMRYLAEHADGLPISDMENHFGVPRSQVEDVVNRLLEENRLRKDDKRKVVMPAK
jgi:DNA-binding IclR family transcriptional regulator